MLLNRNLTFLQAFVALFLLLLPIGVAAQDLDKQDKDMYREFVRLLNYGGEDEFYSHAAAYLAFLQEHGRYDEYYKVKTNVGFFQMAHQQPLQAIVTANELDSLISLRKDEDYSYLATGLKGDVYKIIHNTALADSTYKKALEEVEWRDQKFVMLVHMRLAEVNLAVEPEVALGWANRALHEADSLSNFEYQSMALGMKSYLFFMMAQRDSFQVTVDKFRQLEGYFHQLEAMGETLGRQRFSHLYDEVIAVAETAFAGDYEKAIDMADERQLNVDRQMVIFRIFGMEGVAEKEKANQRLKWGFAAMTALYIFVYIMGRRRLMLKIWKRQRELKVAQEKAEAANRMKAAFIRSMSHEIRTPLNAINGFTQVLCSPDFELDEEEKRDLKERVTSNTEAITIIINELLELSAGESVTLDESNLTDVRLNELCRSVVAMSEERNDKGLKLLFSTDVGDDFTFKSNDETISQILDKVMENALKFTSEGCIEMHAGVAGGMVEVSVTDTGIGIPEERQDDVFNNFVKLDDYKEGVGLGLPICRRLANSLEGDIVLDKSHKNGSRFVLQLPLR